MASITKLPFRWKNFYICFAISLGAMAYGYISAIISTTLGKSAFLVYMGLGDESGKVYPDKENIEGALTSVFQTGAIVGCLCSCYITDTYGRKVGMIYCSVLSILGAAGLTGSQNVGTFLTFRFFAGAGAWGYIAVVPVYCSELAPPSARGFFVGMTGVMLGLGYATANSFGLAFYYDYSNPTMGWRAPLGLQLLWPLMILATLPFLPESPRYLLMVDKKEQAWKVVERIHKAPNDLENEFAGREFYQMAQQAAFDRTINSSWLELFRRPSYRKRVLFGMGLFFVTQATAELVINQYENTFYEELGFDALKRLILQTGQTGRNSIAFIGNLIGSLIIDRFGRRKLLLTGLAGCIGCLCVEAAIVAQYASAGTNKAGLGVGVAALYLFLVFFSVGMDAGSCVILSEIFPNFIRAKGYALAVAMKSLIDIVFLQVTPKGFGIWGGNILCLSAVGFIWLYWAAPETNGMPLEEVAVLFGDKEDIMVYQSQITMDHNTHKLIVEDDASKGIELTNEDGAAERRKSLPVHQEVVEERV